MSSNYCDVACSWIKIVQRGVLFHGEPKFSLLRKCGCSIVASNVLTRHCMLVASEKSGRHGACSPMLDVEKT